ncbi:retrotransposon protein, putative, ty1-copia subclass [Tanacetum coccineum]|uniref:Retrotransposon protein, putative, ty1-copia subclass n=1 Tax=Tanacetum coccineum TaxID=301880 RepID=A0ABQ4YGH6_9ASTR
MVLRVERKLFVIEQPISLAPPTDSEYLRSGMRGKIQKANKKSLNAKGKNKVKGKGKDKKVYIPQPKNLSLLLWSPQLRMMPATTARSHYAPSITRGVVSVHRLVENGIVQYFTNYGISVSKNNAFYFNVIPKNGIYEIDIHDLVPNVNSMLALKRAKHNLDSTYLWHYRLAYISKKRIEKLQQEGLLKSTDDESFDQFIARYAEFFEKNLISQEVSGRAMDLKEIQDEDTSPSKITSEIPMEVEGFEPPQEEEISIHRSEKTRQAPNRLCLNVEAEEHSLGDLNEPTSYKAAMLNSESNKSTDVVVMALPVQNINHSAFRSMFKREKLSRNNFNDWFCQLKLVLRVEKKMYFIEQPLPAAPAADSEAQVLSQWNVVYDAYNEVACLILGKEGKPVVAYVLQMKGYVDQLERLGYMLPQDLIVGLILNGLTKDFAGFVRNYNMHNMGKTISELHAMLIEYEKGLPKKAKTPQLLKKKKQVGSASSPSIFTIELFAFPNKSWVYDTGCGTHICITKQGVREIRKMKQGALYLYVGNGVHAQVEAIGSYDLVLPNGLVICLDNCHYAPSITRGVVHIRAKHNLDSTYLWHCRLAHISKKRIERLQQEGLLKSTDDESFDQCVSCLSGKMTRKLFPRRPERATDLLGIIHTDVCGPLRHVSRQDYALESATRILNMVPTKKVDKTPYELWYAEFFEKNLITQEVSGRAIDLEEIQDEDTSPSEITSKIPMEEHSLRDLNEPTSYKVAMFDSKSNKWIDALNAEIQSMMDNMVWVLVDLPPGCTIVGKTFSPVADIRAIRILISIAAYEIWQMDVKIAFLNGYLEEDIYMVQPEGFVDPNHPRKVCKLQRSMETVKGGGG